MASINRRQNAAVVIHDPDDETKARMIWVFLDSLTRSAVERAEERAKVLRERWGTLDHEIEVVECLTE